MSTPTIKIYNQQAQIDVLVKSFQGPTGPQGKGLTDAQIQAAIDATDNANAAREAIQGDLNQLKDTKAPGIECEASGSIITVDDAAAMRAAQLISHIVPVQSGSGDPSPENVRPISGWDSVRAVRTGKNLADISYDNTSKGLDIQAENGVVTIDGENTATRATTVKISGQILLKAGKYTLSHSVISGNIEKLAVSSSLVAIYDTDESVARTRINNESITFTLEKDTVCNIRIVQPGVEAIFNSFTFTVQLELGSAATAFEPPNVQTLTAALPETVYGGTLDWKTGVLTKTHELHTFYGTDDEGWKATASGGLDFYYTNIKKNVPSLHRPVTSHTVTANVVFVNGTQFRSYMTTAYKTLTDWTNFLKEQAAAGTPFQVYYPLANQETIQLTPQQLETLKGLNNVWSDCGDTGLVYVADTKDWGKGASVALIGATENGMVATKNYSAGDFIVNKETLSMYRATKAIAKGETITPGTNCAATTVVEQLAALYNLINA